MEIPLEDLMEQVQELWRHVGLTTDRDPDGTVKAAGLTFGIGGVIVGSSFKVHPESIDVGAGETPREALLDLRRKLLAMAEKQITKAEAVREMVKGIERRRGA